MKTYKRWISMLLTACMLTSFLTMTSCRKKTSAPDKHDTPSLMMVLEKFVVLIKMVLYMINLIICVVVLFVLF